MNTSQNPIDFYIWGFCDSVPNSIWICVDLPLQ